MNLTATPLLLACSGFLVLSATAEGAVERYKNKDEYLARLRVLGLETLHEDFEGPAWDGVRSNYPALNYAPSITHQRVTWASAGRDLWTYPGDTALISTNQNWGRNGTWGIYDNYLASTLRITFPEPVYGIGFWVNTNPDGEDVGLLFEDRITATGEGYIIPGYGAVYPGDVHPVGHTFIGFIDPDGFTEVIVTGTLQIDEDGVLEGATVYGADDFTFGVPSGFLATPLEQWRNTHFNTAELANMALEATVWGTDADPDGDGLTNDYELALGTNPRSSADHDGLTGSIAEVGGETRVQLSFRRRNDDPRLTMTVERSLNLTQWESGIGFVEELSSVDLGNGYEMVRVQSAASESPADRTFLRIVVACAGP